MALSAALFGNRPQIGSVIDYSNEADAQRRAQQQAEIQQQEAMMRAQMQPLQMQQAKLNAQNIQDQIAERKQAKVNEMIYKISQAPAELRPKLYSQLQPSFAQIDPTRELPQEWNDTLGAVYSPLTAKDQAEMALMARKAAPDMTGGATGVLVQRYIDATGASFPEALQAVQSGLRSNMLMQGGEITPIPGAAEAKGTLKAGEVAGQKGVELKMNPAIAGASEAAQLQEQLRLKPAIEVATKQAVTAADSNASDAQTIPVIEQLKEYNANGFDMPYSDAALPLTRLVPGSDTQKKVMNTELMKQARTELAAPLAKQLGVNPTDRDFQATLDRIFNVNSSKESRAAQIEALEQRIRAKRKSRGQEVMPASESLDRNDPRVRQALDEGYTEAEIMNFLQGKR